MKKIGIGLLLSGIILSSQQLHAQTKAHLNHVAIYVVDLAKTGAFYNNFFQLDTIPEPFHDGRHIWYSIAPGVAMHVIQGADKPKEYYQNNHICFSVPSVPAFVEKLKATHRQWYDSKGTPGIVTTRVDGVKQIWVQDPDNYWLEVNDAKD
jgi:lactoylglutathione lyase